MNLAEQGKTLSIFNNASFNVDDFEKRWRRSRISAIRKVLENAAPVSNELSEVELLQHLPVDRRDALLRMIFDHSRALGLSTVKYLKLSWEISDIAEILPLLGSPCFEGVWKQHNEAVVLKRSQCEIIKPLGSFGCDYWKEALDGLVVGLGENERFTCIRAVDMVTLNVLMFYT